MSDPESLSGGASGTVGLMSLSAREHGEIGPRKLALFSVPKRGPDFQTPVTLEPGQLARGFRGWESWKLCGLSNACKDIAIGCVKLLAILGS